MPGNTFLYLLVTVGILFIGICICGVMADNREKQAQRNYLSLSAL